MKAVDSGEVVGGDTGGTGTPVPAAKKDNVTRIVMILAVIAAAIVYFFYK